jgi:hypothetical protein
METEPHYVYFIDGTFEIVEATSVFVSSTGWIEFRKLMEGSAEQGGAYELVAWVNPEQTKMVSMVGPPAVGVVQTDAEGAQ